MAGERLGPQPTKPPGEVVDHYDPKARQRQSVVRQQLGIPADRGVLLSGYLYSPNNRLDNKSRTKPLLRDQLILNEPMQVIILSPSSSHEEAVRIGVEEIECSNPYALAYTVNVFTGRPSLPPVKVVLSRDVYGRCSFLAPIEKLIPDPKPRGKDEISTLVIYLGRGLKGEVTADCTFLYLPRGQKACGLFDEENRLLGGERAVSQPPRPLPAELVKLAVGLYENHIMPSEIWQGFANKGPSSVVAMIDHLRKPPFKGYAQISVKSGDSSKISYQVQVDSASGRLIIRKRTDNEGKGTFNRDWLVILPDGTIKDLVWDSPKKEWIDQGLGLEKMGLDRDVFWKLLCIALSQAKEIPPKDTVARPKYRQPIHSKTGRHPGARNERARQYIGLGESDRNRH